MKELELIISLIAQLGATGKETFIWWLVFDKLIPGLIALLIIIFVGVIVYYIVRSNFIGCGIRDAMGIGSPGYLSREEEQAIFNWIKTHR